MRRDARKCLSEVIAEARRIECDDCYTGGQMVVSPPRALCGGILGHFENEPREILTRPNTGAGRSVHRQESSEIFELLALGVRGPIDAVACAKLGQRRSAHRPFGIICKRASGRARRSRAGFGSIENPSSFSIVGPPPPRTSIPNRSKRSLHWRDFVRWPIPPDRLRGRTKLPVRSALR